MPLSLFRRWCRRLPTPAPWSAARLRTRLGVETLEAREVPAAFTGLGDLPGGATLSLARAVSADGTTVVGESDATGGRLAFRWQAGRGMMDLGGAAGTVAGVSADGSVVVGTRVASGKQSGFRWADGALEPLADPRGALATTATGVSGDGRVVVGKGMMVESTGSGSVGYSGRAYSWTAETGFRDMGLLPGASPWSENEPVAVSLDGSVAVGSGGGSFSVPGTPVRWVTSGGVTALPRATGMRATVYGLSGDGSTPVGSASAASLTAPTQPARWTAAGPVALEGAKIGVTRAASSDGAVIVGGAVLNSVGSEAFVWTAAAGAVSVSGLLKSSGVDITGWSLAEAVGVSADGRTVVGNGRNPKGQSEAWVAYLDAPPAAPKVEVSGLAWDAPTAGLTFSYTATGTGAYRAQAYWAGGAGLADRIGSPVATVPLATTSQPGRASVARSALTRPPAGATHLLVVLGPADGRAAASGPAVAALKLLVTPARLQAIMVSCTASTAGLYTAPLNAAMAEREINTPTRAAAFLAQVKVESADLTALTERGGVAYFNAEKGVNGKEGVYRGDTTIIPTGTTSPDQWYIGRGLIHLTHDYNYRDASAALYGAGDDRLVRRPTLVASDPVVAARTTAWFWSTKKYEGVALNVYADRMDADSFRGLSVGVNGRSSNMRDAIGDGKDYPNGWPDRQKAYQLALEVLLLGRSSTTRVVRVEAADGTAGRVVTNVDDIGTDPRQSDWAHAANAGRRQVIRDGLATTLDALRAFPPGSDARVWFASKVGGKWVTQVTPVIVRVGGAT